MVYYCIDAESFTSALGCINAKINFNTPNIYYARLTLIFNFSWLTHLSVQCISRPCVQRSKQLLNSNELTTGSNTFAWCYIPHNKSKKQDSYQKAISRFGKYCKRTSYNGIGLDNKNGLMPWGQCERVSGLSLV